MSLRCAESPALAIEQRQIPVRLGIAGFETQHTLERHRRTCGFAATKVVECAAHQQRDTPFALAAVAPRRTRWRTDHLPSPQIAHRAGRSRQARRIGRNRLRIVADVRLAFGVDPDVQFGTRRCSEQHTHKRDAHGQRRGALQAPFAASAARCGSSGSSSFSRASRIAARDPGNAATTRPRTVPASARDSSAAEPIS